MPMVGWISYGRTGMQRSVIVMVEIGRVADRSPPRFRGEAMSFEAGSDAATLSQDEVGGFACLETD
jgi:hypothetical protein